MQRYIVALATFTICLGGKPSEARANSTPVDIGYGLADADGDPCTVTVVVSDDGGSTWDVPAVSLTGDIGAGITPGLGKAIVWDAGADLPSAYGTNYRVRIDADDGLGPGKVLIPGGEYLLGDHHDGMSPAMPVHAVRVSAFYLSIYQVTNQQYAVGLNWAWGQGLIDDPATHGGVVYEVGGSKPYLDTSSYDDESRIHWNDGSFGVTAGKEDHPVVMVSWYGAVAYANWRSAMEGRVPSYVGWSGNFAGNGYRLPTEAEWERAARGGQSNPYYRYPWGDTVDGSMANYSDSGDPYESGSYPWTTPVGYYDGGQTPPGVDMANGYGLYDIGGNVWEWCNDRYGAYLSCNPSPCDNPRGPGNGPYRVLRGGSWGFDEGTLRCAYRDFYNPDPPILQLGVPLSPGLKRRCRPGRIRAVCD